MGDDLAVVGYVLGRFQNELSVQAVQAMNRHMDRVVAHQEERRERRVSAIKEVRKPKTAEAL
jgi:hypothetical protein